MVVIGAQGVLGGLCTKALREAGFDVIRAGRRAESSSDFRLVDLDDDASIPECCGDADIVVSTVRHPGFAAERFALREGGALLSVASFRLAERAELKALGANSDGLVILDAGLGPGVSSLVLKELLAAHPDADGLETIGTFSVTEPSGRGTTIDSYPAFKGARRYPSKVIELPEPYGRGRCIRLAGAEADAMLFGDLAERFDGRAYVYITEHLIRAEYLALNSLGLLSKVPLRLFLLGSRWRSARTTNNPQCHIAAVLRSDRRLAGSVVTGFGNYAMTASAVASYTEVLLHRLGDGSAPSGVLGVENAFDLADLRDGFEKRGIRIAPLQ